MKFSKTISEKITTKDSIEMKVKRGEKAPSYFWSTFFFLSTCAAAIISILNIQTLYKIVTMVFSIAFLFYFCLHNSWFRNKIVSVFNKVENKEEKF